MCFILTNCYGIIEVNRNGASRQGVWERKGKNNALQIFG